MRDVLSRLATFLKDHNVSYAAVVESIHHRLAQRPEEPIAARDTEAIEALFGGMGSLNDVYISRENGHVVEDEEEANQELDSLRAELWQKLKQPKQ